MEIKSYNKEYVEDAYRRGFQQGFFAATYTSDDKRLGILDKLFKWRFKKHKGKLEIPPGFADINFEELL